VNRECHESYSLGGSLGLHALSAFRSFPPLPNRMQNVLVGRMALSLVLLAGHECANPDAYQNTIADGDEPTLKVSTFRGESPGSVFHMWWMVRKSSVASAAFQAWR
jgi:hypothetical protein